MRKITAVLSTVLALSSCSTATKNLAVNSSPQAEIVRKSEPEGINDLRQLVEESFLEEAWVYLPQTEEWPDVGLRTKYDQDTNSVDYDEEKVKAFAVKYSELHFWHIHTTPFSKFAWREFIGTPPLTKLPVGYTRESLLEFIYATDALPSKDDISSAIYFTCLLPTLSPSSKKRSDLYFLASHLGVTNLKPFYDRLEPACHSASREDLIERADILGGHAIRHFNEKKMAIKVKEAVAARKSVRLFESDYVVISFVPYEALSKDLK